METTCQICARAIKANNKAGTIAHHGYTRPGDGWQTGSCYGARHVPFEVGHDAIDSLLKRLPVSIANAETGLSEFLLSPPDTLQVRQRRQFHYTSEDVARPEDFDPNMQSHSFKMDEKYEMAFFDLKRLKERGIVAMKQSLVDLTERRAAWAKR